MWDERAHRAGKDIASMAASGLGVSELHAAAIDVVGGAVGAELTCWATIDPETLAISTMVSGATPIPPGYEPWLAEAECSPNEPHRFATLARRGQPAAKLSDLPARERDRSTRFHHVWRPLGLDRELRLLFVVDGACWGAAGMVRSGRDYSDREMAFLLAVAPAVAAATRLAVRTEVSGRITLGGSPAVVVVGRHGELRSATPAAREWQNRIDEITPGRFSVMMQLMAAGAATAGTDGFRARVRDGRGHWAVLHASPLVGGDEQQTAVAIEPAAGDQLTGLLMVAYGLTPREREICREVIAGHPTADIAENLTISAHTVQDHLKSVFAKMDVRSRGELVARRRPESAPVALRRGRPPARPGRH